MEKALRMHKLEAMFFDKRRVIAFKTKASQKGRYYHFKDNKL